MEPYQIRASPRARGLSGNSVAVSAATAFVFATNLAVLGLTLAPSITWRNEGADSGDLVTAAFTGGIPHPPGYPLYTVLAQILIAIPIGSFAYRVNWLSALAAATTVAVLFRVALIQMPNRNRASIAAAGAAALFFSFSPLFWSQATIAEVYSLHALLFIVTLGALLAWSRWSGRSRTEGNTRIYFISVALALGFGIAHHLTILLLLPAGFVFLWRRVPMRELVNTLAASFLIAFLFYLTLPLRAWQDPPVNWGDPRSLENWWWLISGQLYRGYIWGLPWGEYPARIAAWAKSIFDQFGFAGVALGLWGSVELVRRYSRAGIAFGLTFVIYSLFAIGYLSNDSNVYLIPAYLIFTLWITFALCLAVAEIQRRFVRQTNQWLVPLVVTGFCLLPLSNLVGNYAVMDQSRDTAALDYVRGIFATIPDHAMVVANGDEHIFALWYYRYVETPGSHVVVVAKGLLSNAWYREELRRQHPEWIWPEPSETEWDQFLRIVVEKNVNARMIYWTDPDPVFQNAFHFRMAGPIFQVFARMPP